MSPSRTSGKSLVPRTATSPNARCDFTHCKNDTVLTVSSALLLHHIINPLLGTTYHTQVKTPVEPQSKLATVHAGHHIRPESPQRHHDIHLKLKLKVKMKPTLHTPALQRQQPGLLRPAVLQHKSLACSSWCQMPGRVQGHEQGLSHNRCRAQLP